MTTPASPHDYDPDDFAYLDDEPSTIDDDLDLILERIFTAHPRRPTVEELTSTLTTGELIDGAVVGFTAHQARVIANHTGYLARLTRMWARAVPGPITDIAGQDTDLGALHRDLLEATGHPVPETETLALAAGLDDDLWALLDTLTLTKGATRGAQASDDTDKTTALTCTDPATGTQITLTPTPNGTWAAYLEPDDQALVGATLHLRWDDDSTTTHPIDDVRVREETTLPITPPAPGARPDKARITN